MSIFDRQRGLTLIELILFIVIVGAAVAGVLAAFAQAVRGSSDPLVRKQAIAVAESLLEEMMAVPYLCPSGATCGPVTTSNRTATHALADYHGFVMNGIHGLDGSAITPLAGYTARVDVSAEAAWNGALGRKITVTVSRGGETVTLTGWRGKYGS